MAWTFRRREKSVTFVGIRTPDRPALRPFATATALCRLYNIGYSQTSRKPMIRLGSKNYTTCALNFLFKFEDKTLVVGGDGGGGSNCNITVLTSTVRPVSLSLLDFSAHKSCIS